MIERTVPGFLPSRFGLHFPNTFPHVPVRRIGIPGVISIPIGDASNGLCGGMAVSARDYFEAGLAPPPVTTPPAEGPLFDYLVTRLFASFGLPFGPVRYLELMNPALPDGESVFSRVGLAPHGRAWRTTRVEWPRIRADIDAARPSPLGLVRVKSHSPLDLKQNHQVLAYGYRLEGTRATLRIYDPNHPDNDDVSISIDLSDPARSDGVTMSPAGRPVLAFFRVKYTRASPP
jgi:hypothetical protein